MMLTPLRLALLLGLAGCAQPVHQQYDFGRAYMTTIQVQSDLTRPLDNAEAYALSGVEGIELRQRVIEESTDAESGTAEVTTSFTTQ